MGEIFIGTEALAGGRVTRHELARWYRPVYPNVHMPRGVTPTLHDRILGAWLWSKRSGIVAGVAASALHGAEWVSADERIELIMASSRPARGVVTRNETLTDDEWMRVRGLPVTTPARTAFDLGRHRSRREALARLDALMRARPFSVEDVMVLAKRYRGARGVRQLRELLPLVDGGAASPRESRQRLLFVDAGLPRPTTQVPVYDEQGLLVRILDMAWEDFGVASEYDGEQHQTSRLQYLKDRRVLPALARLGWLVDCAVKEDRDHEIVARVRAALVSRGWRPS